MSINFDVEIDTPEYAIDMKSGLETLQGVSDATRTIAETVLTDRLVRRQNHRSSVRTKLKQTFKGSYGQIFSLEIYDDSLNRKLNGIGKKTFAEVMNYFISEALYLDHDDISDKAERIVGKLGNITERLIDQLRVSSLENIHQISTKFDHEVKVSFRKSKNNRTIIAKFDKNTAKALKATESSEKFNIVACITRFNIFTGNGRLLPKDKTETVAFGFKTKYADVKSRTKKILSENLDHNNGLSSDNWEYLEIKVQPIKLRDGKIVKYIIKKVYND